MALTTRPRNLELADSIVKKAFEIIRYLQVRKWFLENPRYGLLKSRPFMQGIPYVDVDYCQFGEWGYQKPTIIWGSGQIKHLQDRKCPGITCLDMIDMPDGTRRHKERLGGNNMRTGLRAKYQVPKALIKYLCDGDIEQDGVVRMVHEIRAMDWKVEEHEEEKERMSEAELWEVGESMVGQGLHKHFVRSVIVQSAALSQP